MQRIGLERQQEFAKLLLPHEIAVAWVGEGPVNNVFLTRYWRVPGKRVELRFQTGQPLAFFSSWPLFALTHHLLVWMAAERAYPGVQFRKYALLGDGHQ